jgi:hypothetical protein
MSKTSRIPNFHEKAQGEIAQFRQESESFSKTSFYGVQHAIELEMRSEIVGVELHQSGLSGDSTCLKHHTCALACRQVGNKLFENGKRHYQISLKLTYLA